MNKVHKNHGKKLLSIINEQITSLLSYEDHSPQIEIDIVKDNMRKLYEFIDSINNSVAITSNISHKNIEDIDKEINYLLDNAQSQFQKEDEEIDLLIKEQEVALEEQSIEDLIEPEIPNEEEIIKVHEEIDTEIISNDFNKEIANDIIEEATTVVEEIVLEEQVQVEEVIQKEIIKEEIIEEITEATIAEVKVEEVKVEVEEDKVEVKEDKVEEVAIAKPKVIEPKADIKKTIHVLDVIPDEEPIEEADHVKEDVILAKSLKLKVLKSLKSGIGINDKFMITNDLFEGRTKEFNASIKKLDSQENMQQALYLLGDMKDDNLWESDDRVFKILKTYIQRRYI